MPTVEKLSLFREIEKLELVGFLSSRSLVMIFFLAKAFELYFFGSLRWKLAFQYAENCNLY